MADPVEPTAKGNIDFHYDLTEYRTKPGGPLRFRLKVTVCNRMKTPAKGKLVENPWKKGADGFSQGSKIYVMKYGYGHDKESAIGNGQTVELAPKGDKEHKDCATFTWEFDVRPYQAYTDFYEVDSKGKIKEPYLDGWSPQLQSRKIAMLPQGKSQYLAVTFPVPYQMSLEGKVKGAIGIAVTRVTGLPPGFKIQSVFPSRQQHAVLNSGDRQSAGCLILRQTRPLKAGVRYQLRIVQSVMKPAKFRRWPARVIAIDLESEAKTGKRSDARRHAK